MSGIGPFLGMMKCGHLHGETLTVEPDHHHSTSPSPLSKTLGESHRQSLQMETMAPTPQGLVKSK